MKTALTAFVASALLASGAWGRTDATIDPGKAKAWLEKTFGIRTQRVVEADPDSLVTLRSIESRPPSDFRVIVHLENFGPPDPLTPPSSDEEYFINCPSRRFHVERIESFSQNGGRGGQSTSFGPSRWGRPIRNSPEARIVAAVCDPVVGPAAVQVERTPSAAAQQDSEPVAAPAPPAVQDEKQTPVPPPAPAQIPSKRGSVRVQLFAGADRASAERFAQAAPARLAGAGLIGDPEIVQASVGGHRVYRVQMTGLASAAEAAQFCSAAKATGLDCFVPPQAQR